MTTLKEYFKEISVTRKKYHDWLRSRIKRFQITNPSAALALHVAHLVLAAIDNLSDDPAHRTEMLAERQEKRQHEADLLNANITALRVTVSDIARKTKQPKSLEVQLKKIEKREEKIQNLQETFERFVVRRSEEIKKQDEKRRKDAEKTLPGVS
jgi:hypothetical protein